MIIELRSVNVSEVDLIERLFQQVYKQEKGIDYWKWSFQNPHGYINTGLFENNRLIGYYAAHFTKNSACLSLPMIRPNHNNREIEKIFMILSLDLLSRISLSKSFAYIFSTDKLKPFLLMEDLEEAYQIWEYRIPIEKGSDPLSWSDFDKYDDYTIWRYRNHPLINYIFHGKGIFRFHEDYIQIIDYDFHDLEDVIQIGKSLGYWNDKKHLSFWCEQDLSYHHDLIPLWKYYKIFDKNLDLEDIMGLDKLRMGMNYDF